MRTEIQIYMMIDEYHRDACDALEGTFDEQDFFGMRDGFKTGLRLTKEGKTAQEIWEYAASNDANYISYGDDLADAYQGGYTCALYWCADQYDWNGDGMPVYVPGNFLNQMPGELN